MAEFSIYIVYNDDFVATFMGNNTQIDMFKFGILTHSGPDHDYQGIVNDWSWFPVLILSVNISIPRNSKIPSDLIKSIVFKPNFKYVDSRYVNLCINQENWMKDGSFFNLINKICLPIGWSL